MRNLITDVAGLKVGNAANARIKTGVTALICAKPAIASCHVMGGAPGTRDTDLLAPENSVAEVNGFVLAGGSAFGLDAGSGVQAWLREHEHGFEVAGHLVPIAPSAILFDLHNGGDKDWGRYPPYRELGYEAAEKAAFDFALGSAGAGTGALVAGLKGGLGSASVKTSAGYTIGALVAVNALGSPVIGDTGHFRAALYEKEGEFGGLGLPAELPKDSDRIDIKFRDMQEPGANTTIAIIATDAPLSKAEAKRLAIAAHDGFARALWPAHTPLDGDLVFALATGAKQKAPAMDAWIDMSAMASSVMARAIARGVFEAEPAKGDLHPTWRQKFET